MRLLIDAGNSALKWCLSGSDGISPVQFELHRGAGEGLDQRLEKAWSSIASGATALACSVAGATVDAAVVAAASRLGIPLEWVRSQDRFVGSFTLRNGYRDPLQLGSDRWHAMLGACATVATSRPPALVVATAGTATTVDCIVREPEEFRFVGGCIAPGLRIMIESLAARTAGLPNAAGHAVAFPDNTDDAIATGVFDAQAGLVQRVVERAGVRYRSKPTLLVAGGHATALGEALRQSGLDPIIEDNLVLKGLALR
jgi:type III pantothenate kinase